MPANSLRFFGSVQCALLCSKGHLIEGELSAVHIARCAETFSESIHDKCGVLANCIGFIDGTNLQITSPSGSLALNEAYSGHKKKHSLKFQIFMTPDGFVAHAYGPMEGRRYDWFMYVESDLDEQLEEKLAVDGTQYCIYGNSRHN